MDFYAPTRMEMALVWSSPWLNLGMHILKVRVTGRKNASSGGTAIPADRVDFWSIPIGTDGQLNGSVIGTPGSWNQDGSTITNVFDGSLVDFFDAPVGSGSWVGLDLGPGAAEVVTHIRFAPRPGFADRMTSGHFEGANTPEFAHPVLNLSFIARSTGGGDPEGLSWWHEGRVVCKVSRIGRDCCSVFPNQLAWCPTSRAWPGP